jgi:hypothetical protein
MADNLVRLGPLRNGEHEVLMMLDEFGNGGRLDTVLTLAPLIRKNGVRFVFILQDGAQLERLYQRPGQKILMGTSTIKLYMNFQNVEDAQAVSQIAGVDTKLMPQPSYSYRHGRRDRGGSMMPMRVELLPVHALMQMKPEEAILQVTGMPIMRIMKLDSGGERQFRAMDRFEEIRKPQIQPRAWTLEDDEKFKAKPTAFEGVMTRQMLYPDARVVQRRVATLKAGGLTSAALNRPSRPRPVDFLWQDIGGERHIFFSSLDELTIRLNLDATRVPGIEPGEDPAQSKGLAEGIGARERRHAADSGGSVEEKSESDQESAHLGGADFVDVDTGELMEGHRADDGDLEVNVRALLKESYVPPTHRDRSPVLSRQDVTRHEVNVVRSPVLKRQEVSNQFGKMNAALHAMLDESAKGIEDVDALALNDGLESMWRATIDRMEFEETKELVRGHAALVMDPVGEGSL